VSKFLCWPTSPEYAIPWIAGPVLYVLLGALGLPGGKNIGLGSVPASAGGYFLAMFLLLGLDALFLWTILRPMFLTWGTARLRFCGTFVLLTVSNLLLWGAMLWARGRARLSFDLADLDWTQTLQDLDLGLLGLTAVLLVSAVWKTEEPGVSNLRLERANARRLLSRLQEGTIERDEFNDLEPTLAQVEESARPLAAHLSGPDVDLLRTWRGAARQLRDALRGLDYNDREEIRRRAIFAEALGRLSKTN
jgi:hypothetical protein